MRIRHHTSEFIKVFIKNKHIHIQIAPHIFLANFLNRRDGSQRTVRCDQPVRGFHPKLLEACPSSRSVKEKISEEICWNNSRQKFLVYLFATSSLLPSVQLVYIFFFLWPKSIYKTYTGLGLYYWAGCIRIYDSTCYKWIPCAIEQGRFLFSYDSWNVRAGKGLWFIKSCNYFKSQMRWRLGPREPTWFVWGLRATTTGADSRLRSLFLVLLQSDTKLRLTLCDREWATIHSANMATLQTLLFSHSLYRVRGK